MAPQARPSACGMPPSGQFSGGVPSVEPSGTLLGVTGSAVLDFFEHPARESERNAERRKILGKERMPEKRFILATLTTRRRKISRRQGRHSCDVLLWRWRTAAAGAATESST